MNPIRFARVWALAETICAEPPGVAVPGRTDTERALAHALMDCYHELQAERNKGPLEKLVGCL